MKTHRSYKSQDYVLKLIERNGWYEVWEGHERDIETESYTAASTRFDFILFEVLKAHFEIAYDLKLKNTGVEILRSKK